MTAIMTNSCGSLVFWEARPTPQREPAFTPAGQFYRPLARSFARLSAFSANGNHAPNALNEAVCWEAGRAMLFRIAGQH